MRTEQEIEELLESKLLDGADDDYDQGALDMANWILGGAYVPEIGEGS